MSATNTWTAEQIEALKAAAATNEGKCSDKPEGFITNEMVKRLELEPIFEDKSDSMLRSKAVNMDIYKKEDKKRAVGGASGTRKVEFVRAIETMLSLPQDSLLSFEKVSKPQLELLTNKLIALSEQTNVELKKVQPLPDKVTKASSIEQIEQMLGLEGGAMAKFNNAGKPDLEKLRSHLLAA